MGCHQGILHFDYETFSEVNLKEVGAHIYARHPSTRIICVSWAMDDGKVKLISEDDDPTEFIKALKKAKYYAGHNVTFEYLITRYAGKRQWGLPKLKQKKLICTAAIAASRGLPRSLEGVAEAIGLQEQKDPRGQKLINKLCKPRRPSQKNPNTRWTPDVVPQDFEDFYEYCRQDVRTERDVHKTLGELTPYEQEVWQRDFAMNARGIPVNRKLLLDIIKCRDYIQEKIEKRAVKGKPFKTLGQRDIVLEWCSDQGYPLNDYTADTVEAAVKDDDCPPNVKEVLSARQQCSRTSTKKML